MLREQAARTPKGQWVRVVGGWTGEQFAEAALPTAAELNAAAPDTPVFVLHLYQSAMLNRAAVQGGRVHQGHARPQGRPDRPRPGRRADGHAARRARRPDPVLDAGQGAETGRARSSKTSTRHFLRELNRFGLTSAIDAGGGFQNFPETTAR